MDYLGAVIGDYQFYAFGKLDGCQPFLDPVDDLQRIFLIPDYDDSADDLAPAVQFRHPSPDVRHELDGGNVTDSYRYAVLVGFKDNILYVFERFEVTPDGYHIFPAGDFQEPGAGLLVGFLQGHNHVIERDVVSEQGVGVDGHLVLLG